MNRKTVVSAGGIAILFVAVAAVTVSSFSSFTPLYKIRMEQASSGMNFLPTHMNDFTYTTEPGYELNCTVIAVAGEDSDLASGHASCAWTCIYSTCEYTCPNTCSSTCPNTCPWTCDDRTCAYTCEGIHC